jgi:hypothetical protein
MKRFYTLATAMAIGATAVMAQTMIVVDKSNNEYRFGVDRIAQITFEEAVDPAVEMKPTFISDFGGGNVSIVFQALNSSEMLSLDIYGPADATYLNAGTYEINTSCEPFTICSDYSVFYPNGPEDDESKLNPASGSMKVADNDGVYTFDIDITMSDGSVFIAHYEGELDSYTSKPPVADVKEITLSACKYGSKNEMEPGEFYLKGNDADWGYEITIDVFAEAEAKELPQGTYTVTRSTDHSVGSIAYQFSSVDIYDTSVPSDKRGNVRFSEGTLTVTKSGSTYSLTFETTLMNELQYKFTYNGELK